MGCAMRPLDSVSVLLVTLVSPVMKVNLHIPRDILKMCCDIRLMYVVVAVVPLVVRFINDSPRVMGDSVEADILISRPVQSLICRLKAGSFITEQDCEHA